MKFKSISESYPLILASSSPRRKELLSNLRIPFRVIPSRVDERFDGDKDFREFTMSMAKEKAMEVYDRLKDGWILGADTIVLVDGRLFGKPKNYDDAKYMLKFLSGREHIVITGFCIIDPGGNPFHIEAVESRVRIRELSEEEIDAYLETGEPFDKAGAYAVQGIGSFMIKSINGSYTNVVGLPVCEVIFALKKAGALRKFP